MKTVWQSLLLSTLNCIISARRSPQRADGSSQSELWLNPGGLQEGDLMGERKGTKATRCWSHAEFQVAAVLHEQCSDRLGRGWRPLRLNVSGVCRRLDG